MRIKPIVLAVSATAAMHFTYVTSTQATELIYGSYLPPSHLGHVFGIEPMNEELDGLVTFDIVAGGQLFSAATAFRGIGTGVADAGFIVNSYARSELKHAVIPTDLTFITRHSLISDGAAHETYLMNCPECLEDFRSNGTVFLAGSTSSGYALMCNTEVASHADVAGKTIRTAGAMGRLAEAMGGTPVSMSTSDMVEAIARGQLDCIMGPMAWLKSYPIEDQVTHVYSFGIGTFNSVGLLIMNADAWDRLSDEQKLAIWEASPAAVARTSILGYMGEYIDSIEIAAEEDIQIHDVDEATLEMWPGHAASEPEAVIQQAIDQGVDEEVATRIVEAYVSNLEKWEQRIEEAGLMDLVPSPKLTREELEAAVSAYAALLKEHVYDKVDPRDL